MRIAIGGLATECSTFSPLLSTLEPFRIRKGAELLDEAEYPFLARTKAEIIPTLQARAIPGGPVAQNAYETLKEGFLTHLRAALPLDGLYLDMHGAMNVAGLTDAEGDFYAAAREVVGPDCLISASYDLHGNLSPRILESLDMLTAYRTAPHVDVLDTRNKAFGMLEQCLRDHLRPLRAWVPVPVILPGERTSTEYEPAKSLYDLLPESDAAPGVLDASLLVGYVWADEPRSGASAVLTGVHREVLEREAVRLAEAYWAQRDAFEFAVPHGSIDEALEWVSSQNERGLIISDSGDNPTAGGVGDRVEVLRRLLERKVTGAVVGGLADARATDALYAAGVGGRLELKLGATLAPGDSEPAKVSGEVMFLDDVSDERERQAVVQTDGVTVVLSHKRRPYHHEADFLRLGVNPKAHKVTVVKVGYLVPDLKRIARGAFLALSPGAVDQDIERLEYHRLTRPMYPLEQDFEWTPEPRVFGGKV